MLEDNLAFFLAPSKLVQLEKSYNRTLSSAVVYPNANCKVPVGIPSVRHNPNFGIAHLYKHFYDPVREGVTGVKKEPGSAPKSTSAGNSKEKDLPPANSSSKDKRPLEGATGKSDVKAPKVAGTKYCHANLVHVFGFNISSEYTGVCKDPGSATSCPCGVHSTKKELPSVAAVIHSIEEIKARRSPFVSELLDALNQHHN
jgi:hypothetical protein